MEELTVFQSKKVSKKEFIDYWSPLYKDPQEHLYDNNIDKQFDEDIVMELYKWKNGGKISAGKTASIENNYINRIAEVNTLPRNTSAKDFLAVFSEGGAIWRIFWLHCWQPQRFPIYDMHVHRAMAYINNNSEKEIGNMNDEKKISLYLNDYLPFTERFSGIDLRDVDRAMWAFGKFLKDWSKLAL